MKVTGIIVEYNPFHNGHIYHIVQTRKQSKCDILIAVMSGHFTQRGEPSIIDKWTRTKVALEHGVDIVIELPFNYATQSADYFAQGALTLLNAMGIDSLVYGSESNDSQRLIEIATYIHQHQSQYDTLVKAYINKGQRYAYACNMALQDLLKKEITLPNDLLAFSYIKEIVNHHYAIQPISIERTNSFHDVLSTQSISSATSIRYGILNHTDMSHTTPLAKEIAESPVFFNDFFNLLKYKLLTDPNLNQYHLVDEGIENRIAKLIGQCTNMEELVENLTTKRYTSTRIQRTLLSILVSQPRGLLEIDYIRILGMNKKGQMYLNQIKKECSLPIISNFANIKSPLLDLELKATKLYSLALPQDKQRALIDKEYKGHPIILK